MNQKKLASSFVLGTALVAGAVATTATAHAEEVTPTQPTTPSVETKATPVNTTAEDVNKAKTDLDNTQKLVDQNTDDLNKLGQKVDETKTNITNLEDDINKGKNAEPIINTNQDIINKKTTEKTDVTNKLNDANRDNNDAKDDVNNKKRDLDDATNDSNRAKNDVDKYTNITEPTPDEIKKNKDDITKLTADETRVNNDIQNKERTLQDKKDIADRDRVRRADLVRDRDNTQRLVDTDTANRDRIDKEVKRLEKRLADGFPYGLTFNSTSEWNNLFKQYMNLKQENPPYDNDYKRLGDRYMAGEITDEQYTNERNALDVKSRQWTSDWFDRIAAFEQKIMDAEWRLLPTPDMFPPQEDQDETYDVTRISDLDDNLLLDLNQYFVNLLNTTQRTLGFNQGVKVNKNIINFAKDIAKEYEKEQYKGDGHFRSGISNVARKWGLDTTGQFYENLMSSPSWGSVYGKTVSKADLYDAVYRWMHGFFHEGLTAGKYGHATSLVQAQTLGLSFSYVDGILRMHVIQVKDPDLLEADEDGDGLISETEDQKAKNIWNEKYGPNSKDSLAVKDFSTNGVDVNHLTNLRTQVADLNNTIKTNQDKVDNFNRDIKTIDDRKDDVTNATNDLNKSKDELRDITTKKTDALTLERKLQDQISGARNKKQLRDDAVREYNRLEQIRKDKERDYNDALNRQKQTQKKVDELTDQLKNLEGIINDATKKRDDAQRLKDQVSVLEKRLEDEKKKLENLNKDVKDKKDELEKNKKDLETKEKEYIKKKNLFELDKMLNIKKNKKDDIIFGIPKDAPTEDELPPAPLDMLPPKNDEVKPPKNDEVKPPKHDEVKPPKHDEVKPPKNGGVDLLNNGDQTPRGGANRTGNNAGTGKALPNTGDNSRVARQLALGGYGLLAGLGLAGLVTKRKRGE